MDDEDDMFGDVLDDYMYDEPSDEEVEMDLYDFDLPDDEVDQYDFDQPDSPPDETVGPDESIASPLEEARPTLHAGKEGESLDAPKTYLPTHSYAAAELRRKKKRLRSIFLRAAKYGLRELLEKAFPVLRRMYETRPKETDRLLDFHDDQVSLQLKIHCAYSILVERWTTARVSPAH